MVRICIFVCVDIQLEVFEESKGILEGLEDGDVCCCLLACLFVHLLGLVGS